MLILLSDIDGLYTADPRKDPNACLIDVVEKLTPEIMALAGGVGSSLGTGGMKTKLHAAELCETAGCEMVILNGENPTLLYDLFDGKRAEDMFVFVKNSRFYMVAEDNVAAFTGKERFGFLAQSADGINWEPSKNIVAYDHTIKYADGSELNAVRRERPQFVFENGNPVCLFTSFYDGENAYNVAQPVALKEN
jgi:hypothetical protein